MTPDSTSAGRIRPAQGRPDPVPVPAVGYPLEVALVLAELEEYERVLEKTQERGLRWHLAVSWR